MVQFTTLLAKTPIAVTALHESTRQLCSAYLCDALKPAFSVRLTQESIDAERAISNKMAASAKQPPREYGDNYLETLALYRAIAERMPEYDTMVFHASVVSVDGLAYAFIGKSGTGKSTHAQLWCDCFGDKALIVNDDKPLVRILTDGATAFGTPWDGKHHRSSNTSARIAAIALLEQADDNSICAIPDADAWDVLFRQTYRPYDSVAFAKTLTLVDKLAKLIPVYCLKCNMTIDAARVAYEGMRPVVR